MYLYTRTAVIQFATRRAHTTRPPFRIRALSFPSSRPPPPPPLLRFARWKTRFCLSLPPSPPRNQAVTGDVTSVEESLSFVCMSVPQTASRLTRGSRRRQDDDDDELLLLLLLPTIARVEETTTFSRGRLRRRRRFLHSRCCL